MCTRTLVDASMFGDLGRAAMSEWHRWLTEGHGVIVYATSGKYGEEMNEKMLTFIAQFRRSRMTLLVRESRIRQAGQRLEAIGIRSNDRHVLQLALAGEVEVLCANDGDLKADFLNSRILPSVDGKRRAVFPHKASRKDRQRFLDQRKCPNRAP